MLPVDPAALQRPQSFQALDVTVRLAFRLNRSSRALRLCFMGLVALFLCVVVLGPTDVDGGTPCCSTAVVDLEANDVDHEPFAVNAATATVLEDRTPEVRRRAPAIRIVSRALAPPDRPPSRG